MVQVGQVAGGDRKKLKVRELAKGCCGKVKKVRVSKHMLKIYISCFISLVSTTYVILFDRLRTSVGNVHVHVSLTFIFSLYIYCIVSFPDQIFRMRPADSSKNRVWTLSLRKLGQVYIWQTGNWVIVGVNYIISYQQHLLWHQKFASWLFVMTHNAIYFI